MSDYTNFDLLLYAASEEYCKKWVDEIHASPAVGGITARERRRFSRIRRKHGMTTCCGETSCWTPLKIACVTVLVCMSLGFSACVCIPSIRSAIKKVFVDWYEDFIAVDFKVPDETESLETETSAPPPTSIERKAYVAHLPEGYVAEVITDTNIRYCVTYCHNNQLVFSLTQCVEESGTLWVDSDTQTIEYIYVGAVNALLITETESDVLAVTWQNDGYEFTIKGFFSSSDEAIEMAERVMLT